MTLTIETEICRLKCHLHKRVGTEPVARDEVLPVPLELQCLTVILTNKVADPGFSEPNACTQFG
jgi:hypothetical protein